jgi:hypothetical protein
MLYNKNILVIAVWFGKKPETFDMWLHSCEQNEEIDWLLITDMNLTGLNVKKNIHIVKMSMSCFEEKLSKYSNLKLKMLHPYKACDYRPLFGGLLDLVPGNWDYWGHCDLDMVFGNISNFLTKELLEQYDKIFGVGHFSLYKNNEDCNSFYKKNFDEFDYKEILEHSKHRGFDEHIGVNKIWKFYSAKLYENEDIILDVDHHLRKICRVTTGSVAKNCKSQIFCYAKGGVYQYYYKKGKIESKEFMYMHFQKRKKLFSMEFQKELDYCLTPNGFISINIEHINLEKISKLNPTYVCISQSEALYRVRLIYKMIKLKWLKSL